MVQSCNKNPCNIPTTEVGVTWFDSLSNEWGCKEVKETE